MIKWLARWRSGASPAATSSAGSPPRELEAAKAEILPLLEEMNDAANVHDAERHVAFYARDPDLLFVVHDRAIVGWDAVLEQQRVWWRDGKTDVVYTMAGEPEFRMPQAGLVIVTYFLDSVRGMGDGTTRQMRLAISAVWQRRPEGWRIIYAHESTAGS